MAQHSDDEFGLSSSDESEMLKVICDNPLKRESDANLSSGAKRTRFESARPESLAIANKVLKEHFRLQSFKLKQEEAIGRLLDGGSSVVVFPTGEYGMS